jgi:1,2-diacylglycerol 3-beta-galactosyltransferase
MPETSPQPIRVLFLFSDTGGGHRSAAEAIIEALHLEYGDQIAAEMVDIFKDYSPLPLNKMPEWYPDMVRIPRLWGLGFQLSNGARRVRLLQAGVWPYWRRSIRALVAQHPCDVIISVHPLANMPVLRALGARRPPFITVVTDLVTAHASWYHPKTDLCLVPTEGTYHRALRAGLKPEQVRVVGLPVADRFCRPAGDRLALRQKLGWPAERPVVLLVGGGEGMGPLRQTAQAIAAAGLPLALAVVTGRNQKLKARLEAITWPIPTFIYGFVREMPDFMRAADVLVTKAGPGTISEALNAGLPMILYSRLPGQEEGNVAYVTEEGAGVWAPRPAQIVETVRAWVTQPGLHSRARQACQRMARPQAARQIAQTIVQIFHQSPTRAGIPAQFNEPLA